MPRKSQLSIPIQFSSTYNLFQTLQGFLASFLYCMVFDVSACPLDLRAQTQTVSKSQRTYSSIGKRSAMIVVEGYYIIIKSASGHNLTTNLPYSKKPSAPLISYRTQTRMAASIERNVLLHMACLSANLNRNWPKRSRGVSAIAWLVIATAAFLHNISGLDLFGRSPSFHHVLRETLMRHSAAPMM